MLERLSVFCIDKGAVGRNAVGPPFPGGGWKLNFPATR